MTHAELVNQKYQADLKRAQAKDAATAQARALATKFDPTIMSVDEFRGRPVLQFGTEADGRPFSFGQSKAERICVAADQYGEKAVFDAIKTIAGRTK